MADGRLVPTSQGSRYSDEERRQAVIQYAIHGSCSKVAELTEIPESTLGNWKDQPWFQSMLGDLRARTSDRFHARAEALIEEHFDQLEDRLKNGDTVLTKQGTTTIPVRARDLVFSFAVLFDKRQILMRQPTSITGRARGEEVAEELTAWLRSQKARVIDAPQDGNGKSGNESQIIDSFVESTASKADAGPAR